MPRACGELSREKPPMIRNLIFDWAGTLMDDGDIARAATNAVLLKYSAQPVDSRTFQEECVAPVETFYRARIPKASMEDVERFFCESYGERVSEAPLREDVADLLGEAKRAGRKLFICSTLGEDILLKTLRERQLEPLFDEVIGGAAEKSGALSRLLQDHSLNSDETLFIGDTPPDIEAGRAARVMTGAILGGHSSEATLRAASPEKVFASHRELRDFLRADLSRASHELVIPTVGGFIVDAETGLILLVKTRKWSELWGLPGGKIDPGETMESAWEREASEEVGLAVTDTVFLLVQESVYSAEFIEPRHFILINFISTAHDVSTLALNHEIMESAWVLPEDALNKSLNEPTMRALKDALSKGLLESNS